MPVLFQAARLAFPFQISTLITFLCLSTLLNILFGGQHVNLILSNFMLQAFLSATALLTGYLVFQQERQKQHI
jgi:hypothetical protein